MEVAVLNLYVCVCGVLIDVGAQQHQELLLGVLHVEQLPIILEVEQTGQILGTIEEHGIIE